MSDETNNPTTPIPIAPRTRRMSLTGIPALSTSPTSPLAQSIQTPTSAFSQRYMPNGTGGGHARSQSGDSNGSPTSPLAYFLGGAVSPIRTTTGPGSGFPFNAKAAAASSAIDEDEESPPGGTTIGLFGVGGHTRRGSWAQAGFNSVKAAPSAGNDRGAGVLRRLSLSSAFQRPNFGGTSPTAPAPPPPSMSTSPVATQEPRHGRIGRSATMSVPNHNNKKRGISPMGERLLKGHFDGFI